MGVLDRPLHPGVTCKTEPASSPLAQFAKKIISFSQSRICRNQAVKGKNYIRNCDTHIVGTLMLNPYRKRHIMTHKPNIIQDAR